MNQDWKNKRKHYFMKEYDKLSFDHVKFEILGAHSSDSLIKAMTL